MKRHWCQNVENTWSDYCTVREKISACSGNATFLLFHVASPDTQFFTHRGFTEEDFSALVWMSSWALLNEATQKEGPSNSALHLYGTEFPEDNQVEETDKSLPPYAHLSVKEKKEVGRMCKMLIDGARVEWLQDQCTNTKYIEYADMDITPENRMIIARA